jgi:hypothetical protein
MALAAVFILMTRSDETFCTKPFIEYGDQCCLDDNNDGACDKAEPQQLNVDSWQSAINSVDRLTPKYNLDCPDGIKENVLYVVHIVKSQNSTECLKLKERIDVVKAKPTIFENYLKLIDDCNDNTREALIKTVRGFSYGRLLPLKNSIANSTDFYYIYSGCVHEPDSDGGIFSFFQMAVDTETGETAGMSSR